MKMPWALRCVGVPAAVQQRLSFSFQVMFILPSTSAVVSLLLPCSFWTSLPRERPPQAKLPFISPRLPSQRKHDSFVTNNASCFCPLLHSACSEFHPLQFPCSVLLLLVLRVCISPKNKSCNNFSLIVPPMVEYSVLVTVKKALNNIHFVYCILAKVTVLSQE